VCSYCFLQPNAEAQFLEVKNAFTVLSDPQQRADYDRKSRGVSAVCGRRLGLDGLPGSAYSSSASCWVSVQLVGAYGVALRLYCTGAGRCPVRVPSQTYKSSPGSRMLAKPCCCWCAAAGLWQQLGILNGLWRLWQLGQCSWQQQQQQCRQQTTTEATRGRVLWLGECGGWAQQ
jgi:hypothetical protein